MRHDGGEGAGDRVHLLLVLVEDLNLIIMIKLILS